MDRILSFRFTAGWHKDLISQNARGCIAKVSCLRQLLTSLSANKQKQLATGNTAAEANRAKSQFLPT